MCQKQSIVLTRGLAEKYFGADWESNDSIIGASITINNQLGLSVSGIVENTPADSHIQFEMLIPFSLMPDLGYYIDGFGGAKYHTFLLLKENTTHDHLCMYPYRTNW